MYGVCNVVKFGSKLPSADASVIELHPNLRLLATWGVRNGRGGKKVGRISCEHPKKGGERIQGLRRESFLRMSIGKKIFFKYTFKNFSHPKNHFSDPMTQEFIFSVKNIFYYFRSFQIVFEPFWILCYIKINENHRKTKFIMISRKFNIRNPFFGSHYHII